MASEREIQRLRSRLERSEAELQELAYVVSHDLQAPLRTVSAFVELMDDRQALLDEEARDFLELIADGARHMQAMIEGLLAYSRAGSAPASSDPSAHTEAALLEALGRLRSPIMNRGAQVEWTELPPVAADPERLEEIFFQLVDNALKFCTAAPPRIFVEAAVFDGRCRIRVRDNGIGIAGEHVTRIFRLFQRLHTQNEYPGVGVGLAIVARLVGRMDGEWGVEPGEGG
ncbi:MAG: ATP-binding protein, partial [Proteobacteria bacterium]|nr:ATP-binding protein [Pseudomonadota bacterium]